MLNKKIIFGAIILLITVSTVWLYAKSPYLSNVISDSSKIDTNIWQRLDTGLYFSEFQAPYITNIGDYKVQIFRIDPKYYSFDFVLATEFDSCNLTAPEWAEKGNLIGVINAGMYNTGNHLTSSGFLKDKEHLNQGELKESFRMMVAFNPTKNELPEFNMIDLSVQDWTMVKDDYQSFSQSIRMIDQNGNPVYWNPKKKMRMSLAVLGIDEQGNALFLFSRSPFSANEFIDFMLNLPFKVQSAMYLEGGPQTSLYVEHNHFCLDKVGSYVSPGYAHDRNDHFWEIPNMIGFKKKTQN